MKSAIPACTCSHAMGEMRAAFGPTLQTAALAAILGIGAWVRIDGVATMSLWVDEAVAANLVSQGNVDRYLVYPGSNRPTGYLLAHQAIAAISRSELALRLLSILPSLLSLPLFVYVARGVLRSAPIQVLAVATLAFNPYLVIYAKEFKPYALEHTLLLSLLACFVAWARCPRRMPVVLFCIAAFATTGLAYGPAFVAPAYGAVFALACFHEGRSSEAVALGLTGLACTAYLLFVAIPIASNTPVDLFEDHWGESFAGGSGVLNLIAWCWERTADTLVAFASVRDPREAGSVLRFVVIGGALLGAAALLVRQQLLLLAVLLLPILAPVAGGLLGRWPLGPDRVNLFLIAPMVYLSLAGWDALAVRAPRGAGAAIAATLLLLQLPVDVEAYRHKVPRYGSGQEEITSALNVLVRQRNRRAEGARAPVVVNLLGYPAVRYYTRFHTPDGPKYRRALARRLRPLKSRGPTEVTLRLRSTLRKHEEFWILFSHALSPENNALRRFLAEPTVDVVRKLRVRGVTLVLVRRATSGAP